jgi:hypothetical protein
MKFKSAFLIGNTHSMMELAGTPKNNITRSSTMDTSVINSTKQGADRWQAAESGKKSHHGHKADHKFASSQYKHSPHSETIELFAAVGLPPDLAKLNKRELLVELEARSIASFSMKSLKKDMVSALSRIVADPHANLAERRSEDSTHLSGAMVSSTVTELEPITMNLRDLRFIEEHSSTPTFASDDTSADKLTKTGAASLAGSMVSLCRKY